MSAELRKLSRREYSCCNETAAALGAGELYPGSTEGCFFPSPSARAPHRGPNDSSAQAEVTAPPKEACHTIGRDWDDSDLPCDLETSERMQMVHVPTGPRGCGSAPHPRPLGRKCLILHTYKDLRDSRGLIILFLL